MSRDFHSTEFPPPEPTTTMSGGMKVFLGLLAAFGVCCVLCCGGVAVVSWMAIGKVQEIAERSHVTDPVRIEARAAEIVRMDKPAGLRAEWMVDLANPLGGKPILTMAHYRDPASGTVLMLAEFGEDFYDDPEAMRRQVEETMQVQGQTQPEEISVEETGTIFATINGREASFIILRGAALEGEQNGQQQQVLLQGAFKTDQGTGFLWLQAPADHLTDEQLRAVVESIR